ncbi:MULTISPECIES: 1-phosphofructokinase family hexose kinase [unclassified Gordonia (in: high G+C Gram-positive bacteria)]|uniref:1-phosphofructokinase family hexose kinase n=1 Tax=unclassified Gordonia (in: high G+C Gram-positive bacteria) TaxID=2657482 RepID=UPI001F0FEA55|nr:1-phosphofructokinase family hexose kinase [Gordonia sp. ABSL49_1]MCH5642491.1 1-phosphofructokinase family hexose kinase [Gordonia sp. ABSL49_1]
MILTVTPNPSLDRTLELPGPLDRGEVQRAVATRAEAGGKGINVSRVVAEAAIATRAILPARDGDPLLRALDSVGLPYETVAVDGEIRSNITIAEPDGTTTKLNAPGTELDAGQLSALGDLIRTHAADAVWVTLCGSLPPGVPVDWYRTVADDLSDLGCRIAVDTSGPPLHAAALGSVDLLKPNEDELAEVTGADGEVFRRSASTGDFGPIVAAARTIVDRTGGAVLSTLGATGAILTTPAGSWFATPPPIVPRSTVGAGDSSLAGYLVAETRGASEPERLRSAVAYGAAAAALAGTQAPTPDQLDLDGVRVTELTGAARVT